MILDGFNRGFALTVAVLVTVVGLLLLATTLDLIGPGNLAGGWIEGQLADLEGLEGSQKLTALVILSLLTAGAALLVFLELALPRREVMTSDGEGLRFAISREGIGRVVQYVCEDVTGIGTVTPTVKGGSHGLEIDCVTTLAPRFNPIEVGQRLRHQVKHSIEAAVGIPVKEVTVHVQPPPAVRDAGRRPAT